MGRDHGDDDGRGCGRGLHQHRQQNTDHETHDGVAYVPTAHKGVLGKKEFTFYQQKPLSGA